MARRRERVTRIQPMRTPETRTVGPYESGKSIGKVKRSGFEPSCGRGLRGTGLASDDRTAPVCAVAGAEMPAHRKNLATKIKKFFSRREGNSGRENSIRKRKSASEEATSLGQSDDTQPRWHKLCESVICRTGGFRHVKNHIVWMAFACEMFRWLVLVHEINVQMRSTILSPFYRFKPVFSVHCAVHYIRDRSIS